jgi:hypothetical protein
MAYIALSAIAGSIVSLSLGPWESMSRPQIGMAVFVGMAVAIFAVPYLAVDVLRIRNFETAIRVACGITFFGGVFGASVLPYIGRWIKGKFGMQDAGAGK